MKSPSIKKQPKPELADAKKQGLLNIGEASKVANVSAKRIRHYEQIGLISAANRSFANYRLYSQADVHTLKFINSARNLGFSIEEIRELLNLWQNQKRSSEEVKRLALRHIAGLENKIAEMQAMRNSIELLAKKCHGDDRPECPILEGLACEHTHENCKTETQRGKSK